MDMIRPAIHRVQRPPPVFAGFRDLLVNSLALVRCETAGALRHARRGFEFQNGIGQLKAAAILNPARASPGSQVP